MLETFWSQSLQKMPIPAKKTGEKDSTADASAEEPEQSLRDANSESELSPALAKELQIITEKISNTIDEKISCWQRQCITTLSNWIARLIG